MGASYHFALTIRWKVVGLLWLAAKSIDQMLLQFSHGQELNLRHHRRRLVRRLLLQEPSFPHQHRRQHLSYRHPQHRH